MRGNWGAWTTAMEAVDCLMAPLLEFTGITGWPACGRGGMTRQGHDGSTSTHVKNVQTALQRGAVGVQEVCVLASGATGL